MRSILTRARRGTPLRWLARAAYTCAFLAAATVAPIGAQETAPSPDPDAPATLTVVGSVETTSPTALVIRAEDGSQQSFRVDQESTVPPHLSRGQRVTVTYEQTADSRRVTAVTPADDEAPSAAAADRLPPAPVRTAEQKAGPPAVAVLGALAALAVGVGLALRAYARTQQHG